MVNTTRYFWNRYLTGAVNYMRLFVKLLIDYSVSEENYFDYIIGKMFFFKFQYKIKNVATISIISIWNNQWSLLLFLTFQQWNETTYFKVYNNNA